MYEELLIKVALGKATAEEVRQLKEWLADQPDYQALYEELKRNQAEPSAHKYDTYAGLKKLRERIQQEKASPMDFVDKPTTVPVSEKYHIWPIAVFKVAASLLILCGLGWVGYQFVSDKFANQASASLVEISTLYGQRKLVTLPDGSQLWMSAGSRLQYPKAFAKDKREVYMSGEIFFKVSHNKHKPFIIHTDTLVVQVLGTSFVVRSYIGQTNAMVAVSTGKVAVRMNENAKPAAFLTANQSLTFYKNTGSIDLMSNHAVNEEVWKEGHLVFDKMTFGEIAHELERHYNVQIVFANSALKDCVFKASFKPMTLDQILEIMQQTTPFQYDYQVKAKKVTIRGKGCYQ